MSRMVCYFDKKYCVTCIYDDGAIINCEDCTYNPFPNRKVPSDRRIRHDD
jgi:hypothetical protein